MSSPRRIAVVGAGPAGTALALGLVRHGHDVTLVSDRTAEEIRKGSVMSSQVTFESALEVEDSLGITELLPAAPPIATMSFVTSDSTAPGPRSTPGCPPPPGPWTSGSGFPC